MNNFILILGRIILFLELKLIQKEEVEEHINTQFRRIYEKSDSYMHLLGEKKIIT